MGGEENVCGLATAVSLEPCPPSTCLEIIPVERVVLMTIRGESDNTAWR